MNALISTGELVRLIDQGTALVVDCRKELSAPQAGRIAHASAHVPGAIYADLDTDLSDLSKPGLGRHPLPDAPAFSRVLSTWGWTPDRPVAIYDDAGGALAAARLWWMLRLAGAQQVSVLDGGWTAWLKDGMATSTGSSEVLPSTVDVHFDERQLVDFDALRSGLDDGSICLLDARGGPRYRGEVEPLDRVAGHVPGALNRPFSENLQADGRFKPARELADAFRALFAAHAPENVVHMCGSGVTACHNILAMEHAGLHGSRLFAPSWSGWISDPARPVSTGALP